LCCPPALRRKARFRPLRRVVDTDGHPKAQGSHAPPRDQAFHPEGPSDRVSILDVHRAIRSLKGFTGAGYDVGRGRITQALWFLVSGTIFMRWWLPARARVAILRRFGAQVGAGVLIRHRVRIHWPWKLTIGDDSWVGEGSWLLNLEPITIGSNVCISQDAFLCTGSHDRTSPTFEFDNAPITVEDGAWIAAKATVLRGVTVGPAATVGACALVVRDVDPDAIVLAPSAAEPRRGVRKQGPGVAPSVTTDTLLTSNPRGPAGPGAGPGPPYS
jgi:putative colanic acid biosynthesis acetyltransferase WcaF